MKLHSKRTFSILFPIFAALLIIPAAQARLKAMQEDEMSAVVGQSMLELSEHQYSGPGGHTFNAQRLTFNGRIQINANIKRLALGNYEREPNPSQQNACSGNGNSNCDYIKPQPYQYTCYFNNCYDGSGWGFDYNHNPNGYDILINNLSLGYIDKNDVVHYFDVYRPYFEIITTNNNGVQEFAGFRMGVDNTGSVNGYMGFDGGIEILTGQIVASMTDIGLLDVNAYSVRSPLRMNEYFTNITLGNNPFIQFGSFKGVNIENLQNFYLSFQTYSIDYPGVQKAATAPPGFWMYMNKHNNQAAEIDIDILKYKPNEF